MKWLALLLAVFVTGAFASEVVFYDSFTTGPFPNRWTRNREEGVGWCGRDWHVYVQYVTGYSYPNFNTVKTFKAEKGIQYKLSFRCLSYKENRPRYFTVNWGGEEGIDEEIVYNWPPYPAGGWVTFKFYCTPKHEFKDNIGFFGWFQIMDEYIEVDDVELKKCIAKEVGVSSTSLGKIKSLYN